MVSRLMNSAWSDSDDEIEEERKRSHSASRWVRWCKSLLLITGLVGLGGLMGRSACESEVRRFWPGEFERQEAMMIAWPADAIADRQAKAAHRRVLSQIVSAVHECVELVVLTADDKTRADFRGFLDEAGLENIRYRTIMAPATLTWVRDYGPLVTKSLDGGHEAVKMLYVDRHHPRTAEVPETICGPLGLSLVTPQLYLEGGNLLSNGCGLFLTTELLLQKNKERLGLSAAQVKRLLRVHLGARDVLVLESLVDEPNSHVDMFATFTASDTIVVGQYDEDYDSINAAILDRNAQRLAKVITASGPLRVYRVPMPERTNGHWGTYTNVVYANGKLLFPTYGEGHGQTEKVAVALYQELLPGWTVVRIDCSGIVEGNGALHCVTMNICQLHASD